MDGLLLAEEIEERYYNTQEKLENLYKKISEMGGAHQDEHKEEIERLEKDLKAYDAAIDSAGL